MMERESMANELASADQSRTTADIDRMQGYIDGFDDDAPRPSGNRSYSYRHGFAVARCDQAGKPAFGSADRARRKAAIAEARDALTTTRGDAQ